MGEESIKWFNHGAARSERVPERPAHFTWLQGPAESPDPQPVSQREHLQNRVAHWQQERGIA